MPMALSMYVAFSTPRGEVSIILLEPCRLCLQPDLGACDQLSHANLLLPLYLDVGRLDERQPLNPQSTRKHRRA